MFFNENFNFETGTIEPTNLGITGDLSGAYRVISESTEDWYNLKEKMMKLEHVAILKEDSALLQEGAKEFFQSVAKFFKTIWKKIQELWNRFLTFVKKFVLSNKKILEKYKSEVSSKNLTGLKITGYAYNNANINSISSNVGKLIDETIKTAQGLTSDAANGSFSSLSKEEEEKNAIKTILGSEVKSEEFQKAVYAKCRGEKEVEITPDIKNVIMILSTADTSINSLKNYKSSIDKLYSSLIKSFENAAKVIGKDLTEKDDKQKHKGDVNKVVESIRCWANYVNKTLGIIIEMSKGEMAQSRKIFNMAITYKSNDSSKEDENKSESISIGSLLDRF